MGLEFTQSEDYVLPLYLSLAEIYDLGSVFLEDVSSTVKFVFARSSSVVDCSVYRVCILPSVVQATLPLHTLRNAGDFWKGLHHALKNKQSPTSPPVPSIRQPLRCVQP